MSLLLSIAFSFLLYLEHGSANPKKPHIVIIIADDLGRNDVSYHGSNQIPTPNIDALAYNGIIMDRFYTQSSCSPSRAALLTGNYPIRTGIQNWPLKTGENRSIPMDMPTMAEHLKKLGYKTHLVGKWHLGHAYRNSTPTRRGFDTHFGFWNGFVGYFDYVSFRFGPNLTIIQGFDLFDQFKPVWSAQGKYATDLFTEKALEIIDNHNVEEPLFLVLSHLAAHTGKGTLELGVPNPERTETKYSYIKDRQRRRYADVVNLLDNSTGHVVQKLAQKEILQNSIILFFSDNGPETVGIFVNGGSSWPLKGNKLAEFEAAVRCSGVIFSPLFKKKSYVNTELIHLTDWLPTFYSAAGGDLADLGQIDGIDQWKTLSENLPTNRTEILLDINKQEHSSAIITDKGRYKRVQGTFVGGLFDHYYGESGRGPEVPQYDPETILGSIANQAIQSVTDSLLTTTKINDLRSQTDLSWCRDGDNSSDVSCVEGCLFDLLKDPCETTNIIVSEIEVAERLSKRIKTFEEFVVPINIEADPNSNPTFYNNTWCTWLDDDWCVKTTNLEPMKTDSSVNFTLINSIMKTARGN